MSMDAYPKSKTPARHYELDVVKAFSIVFMVCVHVYEQMTEIDWLNTWPDGVLRYGIEFLGGPLAAPVFMFAMGIGMACTRHNSPADFLKRGLRLLAGGFILSFFRQTVLLLIAEAIGTYRDSLFSPLESIFIVDIMHFAGMSFLLAGLLKKLRFRPLWILCAALLMQAAGSWANTYVEPPTVPSMLLGLVLFTGKTTGFPLSLWFVYPAAGLYFADLLGRTGNKDVFYRRILGVSVTVLVSLLCVLLRTGYEVRSLFVLTHEDYYLQDFISVLFGVPVVMTALSLAYFAFRRAKPESRPMRFIRYCSVHLNIIYICQWLLVAYTLAAMVLLDAEMVPLSAVIPVGLAITAAAIGLCALCKRVQGAFRRSAKAG